MRLFGFCKEEEKREGLGGDIVGYTFRCSSEMILFDLLTIFDILIVLYYILDRFNLLNKVLQP